MLNCPESARWQDLNHTGGGDGVLDLLALCASLVWAGRAEVCFRKVAVVILFGDQI